MRNSRVGDTCSGGGPGTPGGGGQLLWRSRSIGESLAKPNSNSRLESLGRFSRLSVLALPKGTESVGGCGGRLASHASANSDVTNSSMGNKSSSEAAVGTPRAARGSVVKGVTAAPATPQTPSRQAKFKFGSKGKPKTTPTQSRKVNATVTDLGECSIYIQPASQLAS